MWTVAADVTDRDAFDPDGHRRYNARGPISELGVLFELGFPHDAEFPLF